MLHITNLTVILAEAQRASARLRRRLGLPLQDADDLTQELLVQLARRLQAFEPDRGSLGAFVGRVLENEARRLAARVLRARRLSGGAPRSLDALDNVGMTLGDRLSDGRAAWGEQTNVRERAERCVDLAAALCRLDPSERILCVAIATSSVDRLVSLGFGSRAGLYRRLRDVRLTLTAYGLRTS